MPDITPFLHSIQNLYDEHGYLVVFLAELGGNTFLASIIFPAGTFALMGGYFARHGPLNIFMVILLVWIGTVAAFNLDYLLGRTILSALARREPRTRFGRRLDLKGRLDRAKRIVDRHGGKAIIICHVWAHLRSLVASGAGLARMRYSRFMGFELISALMWSTLYVSLGYYIGEEQSEIARIFEQYGVIAVTALLVLYALVVLFQFIMRRRFLGE